MLYNILITKDLFVLILLMAAMADYNANIPIQRLKNNEIDESEIYLLFESYGLPKFDF